MSLESEIYKMANWVKGLESEALHLSDAYSQAKTMDPVAVALLTRLLREKHKSADTVNARILAKIVEISSMYPDFIQISKQGEKDPIFEWFMENYKLNDFFSDPEQLAQIVLEKIES